VGAGKLVLVEGFAAGGGTALEELAIPGGHAKLVPVVMANDDLRVKMGGWRGSLRTGDAQKGGEYCTGDTEKRAGAMGVI